jgi:hypothetical protein
MSSLPASSKDLESGSMFRRFRPLPHPWKDLQQDNIDSTIQMQLSKGRRVKICCGVCSEAKDQVEQLSNVKECILVSVLLWCCGRHIYGHDQGLFT